MIDNEIIARAAQIDTEFRERADGHIDSYMKGGTNKDELINRLMTLIGQHHEKRRDIREQVRKITDKVLWSTGR